MAVSFPPFPHNYYKKKLSVAKWNCFYCCYWFHLWSVDINNCSVVSSSLFCLCKMMILVLLEYIPCIITGTEQYCIITVRADIEATMTTRLISELHFQGLTNHPARSWHSDAYNFCLCVFYLFIYFLFFYLFFFKKKFNTNHWKHKHWLLWYTLLHLSLSLHKQVLSLFAISRMSHI